MSVRTGIYVVNSKNLPFSQTDLRVARRRCVLPSYNWVNRRDTHKPFTYEHWEVNPFHLPMILMLSRKVRDDQTGLEELTTIPKELIQRDFLRFFGS